MGWGLRELGRGARWGWGREVREVREGLGSAGWIACLYPLLVQLYEERHCERTINLG